MASDLVTVGRYLEPAEAHLAKGYLADAGIRAVIMDEYTVGTDWGLGNAVGYIKLRVNAEDEERARAALEKLGPAEALPDDFTDVGEPEPEIHVLPFDEPEAITAAAPTAPAVMETGSLADDEPRNKREADVEWMKRAAMLGLLFFPIQVGVFWVLLRVIASAEPLRPPFVRTLWIAGTINILAMMLFTYASQFVCCIMPFMRPQ